MADRRQGPDVVTLSNIQSTFASDGKLRQLLLQKPRKLHSSLSYTEKGSEYFAKLCHQPEYYPAHAERRLLKKISESIVRDLEPGQVVDLGCGGMEKTQILLHEAVKRRQHLNFVACDIDDSIVRKGVTKLSYFYGDDITFYPLQSTFEDCLQWTPQPETPALYTFLGITYGNMQPAERASFLRTLRDTMRDEDRFLVSIDLIKDRATMERAYRDAGGCVRESMLEALVNLNSLYGANFDLDSFEHQAIYEDDRKCIVEYLVSSKCQNIEIPGLGLSFEIQEGEGIEVEFSEKFALDEVIQTFGQYGLAPAQIYSDAQTPYAMLLLRRSSQTASESLRAAA